MALYERIRNATRVLRRAINISPYRYQIAHVFSFDSVDLLLLKILLIQNHLTLSTGSECLCLVCTDLEDEFVE